MVNDGNRLFLFPYLSIVTESHESPLLPTVIYLAHLLRDLWWWLAKTDLFSFRIVYLDGRGVEESVSSSLNEAGPVQPTDSLLRWFMLIQSNQLGPTCASDPHAHSHSIQSHQSQEMVTLDCVVQPTIACCQHFSGFPLSIDLQYWFITTISLI